MTYSYTLIDHDIGGEVDSETNQTLADIICFIKDLDFDFEEELEYADDPDTLKKEIAEWNVKSVIDSLKSFKFVSGCYWSVALPGGHREFQVKCER